MINTRFWNDGFISRLDPTEKLLFIYFLTNEHLNISGIYEMPLKVMAIETGIDQTMIEKVLPRLHPKIIYHDDWVVIPNFPKHQSLTSADVVKGILREFEKVPQRVKEHALANGWGEGLGRVPTPPDTARGTKLNLTKLNSRDTSRQKGSVKDSASPLEGREESGNTTRSVSQNHQSDDFTLVETDEEGNEIKPRWGKKNKPLPNALRASVVRVATLFESECHKALGVRPTGNKGVYTMIQEALTTHKLTEEDIADLFDEWFSLGKPDDVTVNIMNALSRKNINEWRVRNQ